MIMQGSLSIRVVYFVINGINLSLQVYYSLHLSYTIFNDLANTSYYSINTRLDNLDKKKL